MKKFSAPILKTASFPLKNPEAVWGKEEAGCVENSMQQEAVVKVQGEKMRIGQKEDKVESGRWGWSGNAALAEGWPDGPD